jgi:predicted RecB family nuclease
LPPTSERTGLALLPPHSPLDVFFDIEGYPLDEGVLEYLWGCTYFNQKGERDFKDFWAHNSEQEKLAFKQFIHWVYERWQKGPSMHIYHYASYEITACRKLMGRYGVCEYEVDQLLRNEVFVDLYKVVKSGLLIGEPS